MDNLIKAHIEAEMAGDPARAVAMYTEDVEHDVVGFPGGPASDKQGARRFYEYLVRNFHTEEMTPVRRYYGENFSVIEHECTGTVPGDFMGVAGNNRRVTFRMLHVWEFRDGKICRENVWLDDGDILGQLAASASSR